MTQSIFISHTGRDAPIADALSAALRELFGADVVQVKYSTAKELDSGIGHGDDWFRWIVDCVRNCDFAYIVVTPNSVSKPWILWEAGAVYGAAAAMDDSGLRKVLPVVYQLSSSQIPSPIRDSKAQLLHGDEEADLDRLFRNVYDKTDLSTDRQQHFWTRLPAVVTECLAATNEAMLNAPLLPSNVVIEEWRIRLDEVLAENRQSEVDQFHDWMDIAFGRRRDGELQPLDLRIHSRLADIYLAARNHERAIVQLKLAQVLAPRDIYILRRLGKAYLDAGRREEARKIIDRIEQLDPDATVRSAECAALAGRWYREERQYRRAIDVFANALSRDSDSYYLANLLAEASLEDDDHEEAGRAFRQATDIIDRLREPNMWAFATAANAAFFIGDDERAGTYVDRLMSLKKAPTADELQTIEQGLQRISGHVDDGAARVAPVVERLRR